MFSREEILNYRCPRWHDWPDLGLYMDQVVSLLAQQVEIFYPDNQPKPVTATMINNYVKQKIVPPSHKKKYQRGHLAFLYIIFILKPVLSLADICGLISFLAARPAPAEAYDMFCDEIEAAIAQAFGSAAAPRHKAGSEITVTAALAFAYTLLARFYLFTEKPVTAVPGDEE